MPNQDTNVLPTCEPSNAKEFAYHLERLWAAAEARGLEPALVLLRDKRAFQKGWPDLRPTLSEAISHLKSSASHAIGVQPASLGMVVFDCDEGDGPEIAAEVLKDHLGDVVACVTPSSSGQPGRGHVWVWCEEPERVGNWKFRVEDPIDGEAAGELRSKGGQVRLTQAALPILTGALEADGAKASPGALAEYRTSSAAELDPDFDRTKGRLPDWDGADAAHWRWLEPRLAEDPVDRSAELFAVAGRMKRIGLSFDAAIEALEPHTSAWTKDGASDGKYEGRSLETALAKAWAKLPAPENPADDFDDDPEDLPAIVPGMGRRELRLVGKGENQQAKSSFENALVAVASMPCTPRWNELKQKVEFEGQLPWQAAYGRDLDDHTLRLTREFLMVQHAEWAYEPKKEDVYEAVMTSAYRNKYNPILDYLDGLAWDGTDRAERLFSDGFGCIDDAYTRAVSTIFMVGAVARARSPGCKLDTMPVVRGPQGTGKSTGIRDLFGREWFSDAELGDLRGKDAAINLRGIWAHEFAELDKMSNHEIGVVKAFMSRAVDTYRPPYGKDPTDVPRRSVFIASINEGGYLRDSTGNRRFLPLEQLEGARVDLDWIGANRDQLWAEAQVLFKAGVSWTLPEALWAEAAERQAHETTEDPWADRISAYLRERLRSQDWCEEEDEDWTPPPPDKVHSSKLLSNALDLKPAQSNKPNAQRLRRVMESLGWTYVRSLRIGEVVAAGYRKG